MPLAGAEHMSTRERIPPTAKDRLKARLYALLKRPAFERALVAGYAALFALPRLQRRLVFLTPQPESYGPHEVREATRFGARLQLRPSNYFQWHHYFGLHDAVLEVLESLVEPGDQIMDVGANIGLYTLRMAAHAGAAGRVVAVEPNPDAVGLIEHHVRVNQAENVWILGVALGREDGSGRLSDAGDGDLGKYSLRSMDTGAEGRDIEVRSLDKLFPELPIDRLDLIKVDVEGFEPECLEGARETLERHWPSVVVEVSPFWFDRERLERMKNALGRLALGPYRWFAIEATGLRPLDMGRYIAALDVRSPQANLLAARLQRAGRLGVHAR